MAAPDRPDPDELITSEWGRWAQDIIAASPVVGQYQSTTDAAGWVTIPAAAMGLSSITGGFITPRAGAIAYGTSTPGNVYPGPTLQAQIANIGAGGIVVIPSTSLIVWYCAWGTRL
jgi:hypothetical protein